MTGDDVPGDYNTVAGLKQRAHALGADWLAEMLTDAESRIVREGDGYIIENPEGGVSDPEMLFHFGVLAGAALEREYPAHIGGEPEHGPEAADG